VRGRFGKRGGDCFQNAVDVSSHVVIPKSQHTIAVIVEPLVADDIAFISRVLAAINLNDKAMLPTDKISDIRADRFLAYEL
jgi:hypothetical protein